MKAFDLEAYYKMKGKLEDRIESMPDDSEIKTTARNHLLKIEIRMDRQIDTIIAGGIDDMYYINEIIQTL